MPTGPFTIVVIGIFTLFAHGEDAVTKKPQTGKFNCTNGKIIPRLWRCDREDDCGDNSDESNCSKHTCGANEFPCLNGKCIPNRWTCDKENDCGDSSDEAHDLCSKRSCDPHMFVCNDGTCISSSWVCDGTSDCPGTNKEDERNCSVTCKEEEFTCDNGLCISKKLKCDGDKDCKDGFDEANCGKSVCDSGEIMCLDGRYCVAESVQCDGVNNCQDGSDEHNCTAVAVDPCSNNNGECEQICVKMSGNTSKCDCRPGYKLMIRNDSQTVCSDIDECKDNAFNGTCSQICKNTQGSYKCECVQNYSLVNGRYCRADGGHPELLLANRRDLRRINLETLQRSLIIGDGYVSSAVGLDFDFLENKLYWTDVLKQAIFRVDFDNTSTVEEVASTDVQSPDGLAVDWINKHLYWTDTGVDRIEVSSLDGKMRKTLINTGLGEPRAIVLDPNHGLMYWTDWGDEPKIERCGMDGNDRKVIVNTSITWPNGLTIDYVANRLYWVDSKLHMIESSNMLGLERVSVLQSNLHVSHPFAITVFEDFLYWTDWKTDSVKKCSKFGRRSDEEVETIVTFTYQPMGLRVFHPYRQQILRRLCGDNNGGCSHFCLPKAYDPSNSELFACDCPNGLVLSSDRKTCEEEVDPCSNNNGGCEQICVKMSGNTSKCDCNPGYSLRNDSQTVCTDIDECKDNAINGTCSQICRNTQGSYKCECVNNYSLVNGRYCKANIGHPELLLANRRDLRRVSLETLQLSLVIGDAYLSSAVALDFDFLDNKLYWTDVAKEAIFRVDFDNTSTVEEVASTDVRNPDGLAVDWINKHLYWTDTGVDRIEVSSLDGKMRKTLINTGLGKPRAIVLDPNHG